MAGIKGQPSGKTPPPNPVPNSIPEGSALFDYAIPEGSALATYDFGDGEPVPESAIEEPGIGAQVKQAAMGGLDAAGRALDYTGGFMRAGLANVAGMTGDVLQGQNPLAEPPVVTPEDLKLAAVGKGPPSAEYLRRLGVPEGGSLGGVTMRGATGFALDVATDPLTVIAKTVKQIPYLSKLLNAPGKGSEALGKAVYKSSVSAAEKKLAAKGLIDKGTKPIGDALLEAGAPVGGLETLAKKVDDIAGSMGEIRQGLYDKVAEKGITIDTSFGLRRAEGVLEQVRKHPPLRPLADELQGMMDLYKAEGRVPVELISTWKTGLYDSLPTGAFAKGGKLAGSAKQFKAALALDFKELIEQAGNKAEQGLGDAIEALNSKWGTLLDAQKRNVMGGSPGGGLGRMIDGAVLAAGGIKGYAVKKAYELGTSASAKTAVGKALMTAGRNDLANRLARQALVQTTRQSKQPSE